MPGQGFGLPASGQVGGAWGAGFFPPWFVEQANAEGLDMLQAANRFAQWVNDPGPNGGAQHDLGWYWNAFKPGGEFNQFVQDGTAFDLNEHNTTFEGQTAQNQPAPTEPPPAPEQPTPPATTPPPTQGQGQGQNNQTNPVPPRPAGPGGPEPGRWVLRRRMDGTMFWLWSHTQNGPQNPPTQSTTLPTTPNPGTQPPPPVMPDGQPTGPTTPPPSPPNPSPGGGMGGWLTGGQPTQSNMAIQALNPGARPKPTTTKPGQQNRQFAAPRLLY